MTVYLGLVLLIVGTIAVMPMLLIVVVVDVAVEMVPGVVVLGNVWWSTFTSGSCASPLPQPRSSGRGLTPAPPEDGQGSIS
jgi:hypothetical protein